MTPDPPAMKARRHGWALSSHPLSGALQRLQDGAHHDPFEVLGRHARPDGEGEVIRALLPAAETVVLEGVGAMKRIEGSDLFEIDLPPAPRSPALSEHYSLIWTEKGTAARHRCISPYSFAPQITEFDLHLFGEGKHHHAWRFLGAHLAEIDGIRGARFAVWAPHVRRISVVGDFNGWDGRRHPMRCRGKSGIWELFIPGLREGEPYKFEILSAAGELRVKTDPYARAMALRPDNTSRLAAGTRHLWRDGDWQEERNHFDWQHRPISIYELHAGSWRRHGDGRFLDWRELSRDLIPYVRDLGYTHIELMPVMEHPLDESWGYQVTGYYAPSARYGTADDLRCFIEQCHREGIGVILDWVPAHFPRDDFALARFTGETLYEHADPRRGEHRDWGTLIFDYGRNEVRNFLISNAVYWLEEFHFDGLRIDAVASMLYLDYSRQEGEWAPNPHGGRENLEAIAFLRELNTVLHQYFPGVLTIAEESTAWPMVSRPVELGGLGFTMKWNMGWMNDTLAYFEQDPVYRKYHHDQLTFSPMYAWSENFVLPFSHDEVVHMKRSLLDKMPGDVWQKAANLRLLFAWQYAHPGKKLLFMGGEFGQWREWSEARGLDWFLLEGDRHRGLQALVRDLNHLYRAEEALHRLDFDHTGFQWIDCHDTDHSTLSFIRKAEDPDRHILCIMNFTPVPRHGYRLGVPAAREYHELLNTDSRFYGGSDLGNAGIIPVRHEAWMGFEHSIVLTLPPLAALFLAPGGHHEDMQT